MKPIQRWGFVLATLNDFADMEGQLVAQKTEPGIFVPDDLIYRWFESFLDGDDLTQVGLSEHILDALDDFDFNLRELIEIVPEDSEDPEEYIRTDEVWGTVRELADITLDRIIYLTTPVEVDFTIN